MRKEANGRLIILARDRLIVDTPLLPALLNVPFHRRLFRRFLIRFLIGLPGSVLLLFLLLFRSFTELLLDHCQGEVEAEQRSYDHQCHLR
jgi:hypothetical protein